MGVRIHPHAAQRMRERGATYEEVVATVSAGEQFPAKFGRTGFRCNFGFDREWRGQYYRIKQVEVYAVRESGEWMVISVITRYF